MIGAAPKALWHYTGAAGARGIVRDGFIRRARIPMLPLLVWFSSNAFVEATASACMKLGARPGHMPGPGALYRLALGDLDRALFWRMCVPERGLRQAVNLELGGWHIGANHEEWFVVHRRVSIDQIDSIEEWSGQAWHRIDSSILEANRYLGATPYKSSSKTF
jgi:hypothetical protein